MTRVFRHYRDREECAPGGMWRNVSQRERDSYAMVTADLMALPEQFEQAMREALTEWPNSCEVALTNPMLNQRAWMGHAGCYLATGSPEDATRLGWHQLDGGQQHQANAAADRVILTWKHRRANGYIPGQVDLFELVDHA